MHQTREGKRGEAIACDCARGGFAHEKGALVSRSHSRGGVKEPLVDAQVGRDFITCNASVSNIGEGGTSIATKYHGIVQLWGAFISQKMG